MTEGLRWGNHYLCPPAEFDEFWQTYTEAGTRSCLLIAGRGFDPRTLEAPRALVHSGLEIVAASLIHLIDRYNPSHPASQSEAAQRNENAFRALIGSSSVSVESVVTRTSDGLVTGGQQAYNSYADFNPESYTDVIVDITALPTSIYFPLIGTLLRIHDETQAAWNLHCVVCENAQMDHAIRPEGGDRAELMYGFTGGLGQASQEDQLIVWAPVLGENQADSLRKIASVIGPSDVKPVLPFPARNPRRGDNLVGEYATDIFQAWDIGPSDLIYAHEQDPFDLYEQLSALKIDYSRALELAGPVQTVVSAHGSKLLSLGVLLAAYEHELAVMHVEPAAYAPIEETPPGSTNELFEIWLAGEPYGGKS